MTTTADRKLRGAWYTPGELVDRVVDGVLTAAFAAPRDGAAGRHMRIVDPACGDGRFLCAAAERIAASGNAVHVVGVDVDSVAVHTTRAALDAMDACGGDVTHDIVLGDALTLDWADRRGTFDLVIGNPPFLSQMAAATTRGGASRRGGGPYADAAVEFLALAAELVDHAGGRVAFVLPQSLLSARDARAVRDVYDVGAELIWSWWTGERVFDAQVLTCALAFEFRAPAAAATAAHASSWSHVVTSRRGVPPTPGSMVNQGAGTLGDRARLNANFRDEYYGMISAVGDHDAGPPLITSGLIDPGRSLWGAREVTFAKRRFARPRIDLEALDGKMPRWARERLVPKVLIANQTKIIEAVADPFGDTLPGVPVVAAYPLSTTPAGTSAAAADAARAAWEIAAVLTSPMASAWAWHRSAGTGLSADAIRLGPVMLGDFPWPAGELNGAVTALRNCDVRASAAAVHRAYGLSSADEQHAELMTWWLHALERIEARQPTNVTPSAEARFADDVPHSA